MIRTLLVSLFLILHTISLAAIVKGTIQSENGEPLAYASIVISDYDDGTFSNENGEFELNLEPGAYTITFRYIGYKSVIKNITIGEKTIFEKVILSPEVIKLKEVVIGKGEDPALSIMRKTIAMSPIHHMELQSYTYKAYTKGNLKVVDVPFLLEKEMKKQFMEVGQLYVFESVVQFDYQQPNQLKQRTIAKKDNLPPSLKTAFSLNLGTFSFYDPTNTTSPVTQKGARNYRYEYLGFFEENNTVINKIKVIPKLKNAGLFSGTLNIIDNSWYVHSYDFRSSESGSTLKNKVIYRNQNEVWIPSNFESSINISILGIEADIKAIASVRDLKFSLNPKFSKAIPEIFDDKLFDAPPVNTPKAVGIKDLKSLKKELLKEVKEESESKEDKDFTEIASYSQDSLFDQKDSLFWELERLVPLTKYEIEGFKQADSIIVANREKIEKRMEEDSTEEASKNKFKILHLLLGHRYLYGDVGDSLTETPKYSFQIGSFFENLRFNAVEGLGIGVGTLSFTKNNSLTSKLVINANTYYSFAQKRLFGNLELQRNTSNLGFKAKAGSEVLQVNEQNPISNLLNASYALFANDHRAKFFQKNYLSVDLHLFPYDKVQIGSYLELAQRSALRNELSRSPIKKQNSRNFERNSIEHSSEKIVPFIPNNLTTWSSTLSYYPFLSKSKVNGKIRLKDQNKASIKLNHELGLGANGFGKFDVAANYKFRLLFVNWESRANTGFFYKRPSYFVDFKHFNGNRLFTSSHADFRNLDYYDYSTDGSYIQLFNTILPQKLLFTQLNFIQKAGIKEYVFHNFLATSNIRHNEAGYGWQVLQGALNLEVVRSWNKFNSPSFSFRIWSNVNL